MYIELNICILLLKIKWCFEYKFCCKIGEYFIVGIYDRYVIDWGILEVGWFVVRSYEIIGKFGKIFFEIF